MQYKVQKLNIIFAKKSTLSDHGCRRNTQGGMYMRICIVGGGNIGTLLAGEAAAAGHDVTMYTSKPECWSNTIVVKDIQGAVIAKGNICSVTNDLSIALRNQDYICVTLPSIAQKSFAEKAKAYVAPGTRFVMIPGYGGTEFLMKAVLDQGAILIGFERVQAISRLIHYGQSVCMRGRKEELQLAVYPPCTDDEIKTIAYDMEVLFRLPVKIMPNYLNITFTPSNPVLHTSRLYSMFKNYQEGVYYPRNIPFYDGWTDFSSEVLFRLDDEVQLLCSTLGNLDLRGVKSLKIYYESPTISAMSYKLTRIDSFHGIMSPMKEMKNGWIPDFNNRYFSCDFNYGLEILRQFAEVCHIRVPMMDTVMQWYYKVTHNNKATIDIRKYGIHSKDDIYLKYLGN